MTRSRRDADVIRESVVASAGIDVDGRVDLLARSPRGPDDGSPPGDAVADIEDQAWRETDANARESRLKDVMIVLERHVDGLRDAIEKRVRTIGFDAPVSAVKVTIDPQSPVFHVHVSFDAPGGEPLAGPTVERLTTLETVIAEAVFDVVSAHAAKVDKPRWRPSVTASVRQEAAPFAVGSRPAPQIQTRPPWFRTMFWLLLAVILAAVYVYVKNG